MKLEKYISDLLYRYDLVIVPGFGGIIGRKKSAHIDFDTYIFSPPYKELSFNADLVENDGLLARYVATVLQISNEKALSLIEQEVNKWHLDLQNNKKLHLEQIGIFNRLQNNIIFLPLSTKNYLNLSYGLNAYVHRPVSKVKKPVTKQNIIPVKKHQPKQRQMQAKNNSHNQKNQFWKYAAVFLIGLGLIGGGYSIYVNSQQETTTYQKATFVLKQDFPAVNIGNKGYTSPEINDVSNTNENTTSNKKYFIVSGAFRNKENAQNEVTNLINSGFQGASIIGQNKHKLWMVAYQGFETDENAHAKLGEIKAVKKAAWVYKVQ